VYRHWGREEKKVLQETSQCENHSSLLREEKKPKPGLRAGLLSGNPTTQSGDPQGQKGREDGGGEGEGKVSFS